MTTTRRSRTRTSRRVPSTLRVTPAAPVRLGRVRTARQRIANGFYDRDEVRERLVAVVLEAIRKL
jgi:hypothetical protein